MAIIYTNYDGLETLTFNTHTFINSISCLHLSTFRQLAAIVSEISTVFTFPIEKPKLPNFELAVK